MGYLSSGYVFAESDTIVKDPAYANMVNTIVEEDYNVFLSGGESSAIGDEVTEAMSASQLISMYEKNELSANKKLKGKYVRIKSVASEIGENAVGQAYVRVDGKNQFQNITLFVDGNDERILNLEKGSNIDFSCRMDKYIMRTPMLKSCVFTTDLAKQRKDKILETLSGEDITFGYQAFFIAAYEAKKDMLLKPCSKSGKVCLNAVVSVFNDEKTMSEVKVRTKKLVGDKKIPMLPF